MFSAGAGLLDWLHKLDLAAMAIVVYGFWFAAMGLIGVIVALRAHGPRLDAYRRISQNLLGTLMASFALYTALLINSIWRDRSDAQHVVMQEARAIEQSITLSRHLSVPDRGELEILLRDYVQVVVLREWPGLDEARNLPFEVPEMREAMDWVLTLKAATPEDSFLRGQLVGEINRIEQSRTRRLAIADQEISIVVWITLMLSAVIVGSAVAMVHVENRRTEALTLTLLSILIGSAFWVLLAHDQPFVGTLSVSPQPLISAVNAL